MANSKIQKTISDKQSAISQRGQVIVVTLLILLVSSLVVLAVASRSLTGLKISQTSDESAKAFSAAESGVEQAVEQIRTGNITPNQNISIVLPGNANAGTFRIEDQGSSSNAFLSAGPIVSDVQSFQVYLADYNNVIQGNYNVGNYASPSICLLWGNEGAGATINSTTPALEVSVIYQDPSDSTTPIKVKRFAIDPNTSRGNNFVAPNNDVSCPKTSTAGTNDINVTRTFAFAHKLTFGVSGNLVLMRLRLLYSGDTAHFVGVKPQ